MSRRSRPVWIAALVLFALLPGAYAWGPHPDITRAALAVLPEKERWNQLLGGENVSAFTSYCWMPDNRGQDMRTYYADDYLLFRAVPKHIGHVMPEVQQAWAPCFRRALQALRTETPANACRQIGPILHFVEDTGAPPHAKEKCPHHSEMENWIKGEQVAIPGYVPQLLGKTEDEAVAGLEKRLRGLVAFSATRADRALPFVTSNPPQRAKVEPILLESGNECARAAADLLYTLFTLGLAEQPEGAVLEGTVTADLFPGRNEHGARIVLLGSDYSTLADRSLAPANGAGWVGSYRFHRLLAGTYRVLAYRTASQFAIGGPVVVEEGKAARLDFTLAPTAPAGNIVENPDGQLSTLGNGAPDRWSRGAGGAWASTRAVVNSQTSYRCGAVLRDPKAKVRFQFQPRERSAATAVNLDLPTGQLQPEEVRYSSDGAHPTVVVTVQSDKPLAEAIERVWVVPELPGR